MNRINFVLNGYDISFVASAPADITLEQLLKQADRIEPDYSACGIRSADGPYEDTPKIIFDYDDVRIADGQNPSCSIHSKYRIGQIDFKKSAAAQKNIIKITREDFDASN